MPVNKSISEGDSFTCPHCQSLSFAKLKTEYEGFTARRAYLVCAFCLAELLPNEKESKADKAPVKSHCPEKLSSLFGETGAGDEPVISELLLDDQERRFCKDCLHNFITPFKCHCDLHQKEVEPLQDCPDFEAKSKTTSL